jgi:arsenite methyltransferase
MPGQLPLENLPYAGQQSVLDIGCGTGFPLLLLARRFGPSVKVYGVDNWQAAMVRTRQKIAAWELENVTLIEADAQCIDLPDRSIDLITSNLGLNNFENVSAVLGECKRLLKPNGKLCLSTNLYGTFAEFYAAMKAVAPPELQAKIQSQEGHRYALNDLQKLLERHGFQTVKSVSQTFTMTYANGTAFLNDYFIGMGFLPSWIALVDEAARPKYFVQVESRLNAIASSMGKLVLTVPIATLEMQVVFKD